MRYATAVPIQVSARGIIHRVTFRNGPLPTSPVRDISGSTVEIVFRDPSGTETRRAGTIVGDGSTGQATFTDTDGDFNNATGDWVRWGTVDFGGGNGPFPSTSIRYRVVEEGDA